MRLQLLLLLAAAAPLRARDHAKHHPADTAFAALQKRGKTAMGVDQYASTHRFDVLPDGGRIALESDRDDPAAVSAIRAHFREIAGAVAEFMAFQRREHRSGGVVKR